jgi:NADPH:quinone reductase-like Zn-dependent oxidoreductase
MNFHCLAIKLTLDLPLRTGYAKHVSKYTAPVQNSATIRPGEDGADGYDLGGKVVVVTGANSGIGKELATYAAAKGAKLYMLCRSKERAEIARDEIVKLTSNEKVDILLVRSMRKEHIDSIV